MKNLQITGLAQETDFSDPGKTRSVMIIDEGSLRLEISDASVEALLRYAVGEDAEFKTDSHEEPQSTSSETSEEATESEEEEEDEDGVRDEAGIAQI